MNIILAIGTLIFSGFLLGEVDITVILTPLSVILTPLSGLDSKNR